MASIELARYVDRLMRRIESGLNARSAAFDFHRVGQGGGIVLLTLAEIAPSQIGHLAQQMARDKSQITRAIKALESKGLVQREMGDQDARVSVVSLTPLGRETVAILQSAVADSLSDVLQPLSEEEKVTLQSILMKL